MHLSWRALLFFIPCFLAQAHKAQAYQGEDPSGGGDPDAQPDLTNWVYNSSTAPISPSHDPFYHLKYDNITGYTNGAIIAQRQISVDGSYQGVESAMQVAYRSEDAHGKPTISIASILKAPENQNSGRFVVVQVLEEANALDCAPTYQLFGRNGITEVQQLLNRGYSVVVPDYEGPRGSFTVGILSGNQILDAARAALKSSRMTSGNLTASIGLWGFGTAAHATGWAAELAASYAPELPIKGVAVGAYISNLLNWVRSANASPQSGSVVASLLGMASEYKDVSDMLAEEVLPHRRGTLEAAQNRCSNINQLRYYDQNITTEFFSPGIDPFNDERVVNVYNLNSLGKRIPKVSMFIYQGSDDNVVSTTDVRHVVKGYCGGGASIRYREYSGLSHSAVRGEYGDVLEYFDDALSGSPPLSSCGRIKGGNYY